MTIVVPCYNQADLLHQCLQSILAQTFGDWEALVVDDASSVGHLGLVVSGMGDPRMRMVRHERNSGLAAARNTGFAEARSDLVLPLDADDCLAPQFLERTIPVLGANNDADCVFTDFRLFGGGSGIWHYSVEPPAAMLRRQWLPGPGTLMRKSLWRRVGGYCEAEELRVGNEDWDFWLGATEVGFRAIAIPEALYWYRRSASSMSAKLRYHDIDTREFMYRRHQSLFDRYDAGPAFLAQGCVVSALAALEHGEKWRAFRLGYRALRLPACRVDTLRDLVKGLAPRPLIRTGQLAVRAFTGVRRHARGGV